MKKILADFEISEDPWGEKYYSLRIPIIKNYKGNLTKTKNYIPYSADKPYKKKIKKTILYLSLRFMIVKIHHNMVFWKMY